MTLFNPLGAKFTKWSNTLKQLACKQVFRNIAGSRPRTFFEVSLWTVLLEKLDIWNCSFASAVATFDIHIQFHWFQCIQKNPKVWLFYFLVVKLNYVNIASMKATQYEGALPYWSIQVGYKEPLATVGSKELSIIRYFQFCQILSVNFEIKLIFVNRSHMTCIFFMLQNFDGKSKPNLNKNAENQLYFNLWKCSVNNKDLFSDLDHTFLFKK